MSHYAGRGTQGMKTSSAEKEEQGQFITKDFISKLKLEISQKVKPSKSVLQALKHSNIINQSYKKNIEQLSIRIEELTLQNQQLKEKVKQLEQKPKETNTHNSLILSASEQKLISEVQISNSNIPNDEQEYIIQIRVLKERINQLQLTKSIKESKIKEILEREAMHIEEIDCLKSKNKTLQSSIIQLQSSLHKLKVKPQTAEFPHGRKKSAGSQKFKEYINHSDSFKEDQSIEEAREIQHLILPKSNNHLLESFTQDIQITEPLGEQAENKKAMPNSSFIEMDEILGEDVSSNRNTKTNIEDIEDNGHENLNNSVIAITINPYIEI